MPGRNLEKLRDSMSMSRRFITCGAGLILAVGLWLAVVGAAAAQIERGGPAPTRTPVLPTVMPGATPTPDRLAPPPTAAVPNQADEGAQLYWLHCQPCHGDKGQGLTDEWRAQYPPEEQYCWESGCHGERPYDQAFALPTAVPAVIGDTVLQKFETMDGVYRYVSVSMPYFFPGDLTQEEYLAILAHIARENGLWDGTPLTTENLGTYRLRPAMTDAPTAQSTPTPQPASVPDRSRIGMLQTAALGLCGVAVITALIGGVLLWRNRGR